MHYVQIFTYRNSCCKPQSSVCTNKEKTISFVDKTSELPDQNVLTPAFGYIVN